MGCSRKTGSGSHFFFSTSTAVSTTLTSTAGAGPSPPATATSWRLLSIAPFSYSRPSVIDSSLQSTNFEELLAGDLYAIEPIVMQVLWDPTSSLYEFDSTNGNMTACEGSIYLFPPNWLGTAAGTYLAGTGFIIDIQMPNLQNNERQVGGLAFQFDGKTEPLWYDHTKA